MPLQCIAAPKVAADKQAVGCSCTGMVPVNGSRRQAAVAGATLTGVGCKSPVGSTPGVCKSLSLDIIQTEAETRMLRPKARKLNKEGRIHIAFCIGPYESSQICHAGASTVPFTNAGLTLGTTPPPCKHHHQHHPRHRQCSKPQAHYLPHSKPQIWLTYTRLAAARHQ